MDIPASVTVHSTKDFDQDKASLPGTDYVIPITKAAVITHNTRPFVAIEATSGKVFLASIDKRFEGLFIPGNTLQEALNNWLENFARKGEGL